MLSVNEFLSSSRTTAYAGKECLETYLQPVAHYAKSFFSEGARAQISQNRNAIFVTLAFTSLSFVGISLYFLFNGSSSSRQVEANCAETEEITNDLLQNRFDEYFGLLTHVDSNELTRSERETIQTLGNREELSASLNQALPSNSTELRAKLNDDLKTLLLIISPFFDKEVRPLFDELHKVVKSPDGQKYILNNNLQACPDNGSNERNRDKSFILDRLNTFISRWEGLTRTKTKLENAFLSLLKEAASNPDLKIEEVIDVEIEEVTDEELQNDAKQINGLLSRERPNKKSTTEKLSLEELLSESLNILLDPNMVSVDLKSAIESSDLKLRFDTRNKFKRISAILNQEFNEPIKELHRDLNLFMDPPSGKRYELDQNLCAYRVDGLYSITSKFFGYRDSSAKARAKLRERLIELEGPFKEERAHTELEKETMSLMQKALDERFPSPSLPV